MPKTLPSEFYKIDVVDEEPLAEEFAGVLAKRYNGPSITEAEVHKILKKTYGKDTVTCLWLTWLNEVPKSANVIRSCKHFGDAQLVKTLGLVLNKSGPWKSGRSDILPSGFAGCPQILDIGGSMVAFGLESDFKFLYVLTSRLKELTHSLEILAARAKKLEPGKDEKSGLPKIWVSAIRLRYQGETNDDFEALASKLLKAKKTKEYAPLLEVPSKYKRAYRMMINIKKAELARLLPGDVKIDKRGVLEGGMYKPLKGTTSSSWCVDVRAFADPENIDAIGLNEHNGHYALLLETDLDSHRKQFLFNPDTLPFALKTGRFGREREIVSIGNLPLLRMVYAKCSGSSEEPSEILLKLLKQVPEYKKKQLLKPPAYAKKTIEIEEDYESEDGSSED